MDMLDAANLPRRDDRIYRAAIASRPMRRGVDLSRISVATLVAICVAARASAGPPIRVHPLQRSSSISALVTQPAPTDARATALAERLRASLDGGARIARQVEKRQ